MKELDIYKVLQYKFASIINGGVGQQNSGAVLSIKGATEPAQDNESQPGTENLWYYNYSFINMDSSVGNKASISTPSTIMVDVILTSKDAARFVAFCSNNQNGAATVSISLITTLGATKPKLPRIGHFTFFESKLYSVNEYLIDLGIRQEELTVMRFAALNAEIGRAYNETSGKSLGNLVYKVHALESKT